jgi:hypothetical protein
MQPCRPLRWYRRALISGWAALLRLHRRAQWPATIRVAGKAVGLLRSSLGRWSCLVSGQTERQSERKTERDQVLQVERKTGRPRQRKTEVLQVPGKMGSQEIQSGHTNREALEIARRSARVTFANVSSSPATGATAPAPARAAAPATLCTTALERFRPYSADPGPLWSTPPTAL